MNRRMKKLYKELTSPPELNAKNIIAGVNERLNLEPSENRRYIRQRKIRVMAVAFAVIISLALTALAVSSIDFNVLRLFFAGESEILEQYVTEPEMTLDDGRYKFTVNQALITRDQALIVFTVEALTDESLKELENLDELNAFEIFLEGETIYTESINSSMECLRSMDTPTTRSFAAVSAYTRNNEMKPIVLTFLPMDGENQITIEAKGDVETIEFDLPGQPCGAGHLVLNPIGIRLTRTYSSYDEPNIEWADTYFRMEDGEVRTFNQIYNIGTRQFGRVNLDSPENEYEYSAISNEVLDLSRIKSVIVCGLEYELEDPDNYTEAETSDFLKPFEFRYYDGDYIAVEEIFARLNAYVLRDDESGTLTVSYGGITAGLTLGSSVVVTNGQPVELSGPVYMDGEGRIMAPGDFIYKCILLLNDCVDWNAPREERVFMIYP